MKVGKQGRQVIFHNFGLSPFCLATTLIGYGETNPAVYEAAPKDLYSKAAKANMRVFFEIVVE